MYTQKLFTHAKKKMDLRARIQYAVVPPQHVGALRYRGDNTTYCANVQLAGVIYFRLQGRLAPTGWC